MSGEWAGRDWPPSAGTPSAPPCWPASSSWRPGSPMGWGSGGRPARKGDPFPSMTPAGHNVLRPGVVDPLFAAGLRGIAQPSALATVVLPWILVLVLLLKLSPRTARYGTLSMALLVGVGAAGVVGGAVSGTLGPPK